MKFSNTLIIALFAILFSGCSDNKQDNAVNQPPIYTPPTTSPPPINTTTAGVVHHYICPKNCVGSGGPQAGSCPVCNSQYVHNAAYHNQPGVANTTTIPPGTNPMFQQGKAPQTTTTIPPPTTTTVPPPTASPAQNAAGVYHYTCSNGCAGGSGTTGNCASCGAALAHNAAYHNN